MHTTHRSWVQIRWIPVLAAAAFANTRVGGSDDRHFCLTVLETGRPRPNRCLVGTLSLVAGGAFSLCAHVAYSLCMWSSVPLWGGELSDVSSHNPPPTPGPGSHPMTLCSLDNCLRGPISKYSHIGDQAPTLPQWPWGPAKSPLSAGLLQGAGLDRPDTPPLPRPPPAPYPSSQHCPSIRHSLTPYGHCLSPLPHFESRCMGEGLSIWLTGDLCTYVSYQHVSGIQ